MSTIKDDPVDKFTDTEKNLENHCVKVENDTEGGKNYDRKKSRQSVALKQNSSGHTKITAKGSGEIAEQILQIAFNQGVKVRTDSDLVEILATVDVESEIPLEALTAVVTILNYVYEAQNQSMDKSARKV